MPYLTTPSGCDVFLFTADKPPYWHSLSEKLLEPLAPGDHRVMNTSKGLQLRLLLNLLI